MSQKSKYQSLTIRDNKHGTYQGLVVEMIEFYKNENPDNLPDFELDKIGISYVLKKCITSHHKSTVGKDGGE